LTSDILQCILAAGKTLLLENVSSGYSLYLIHSIKGAAAAPMQASRPAPSSPGPPSRISSLGLLDYFDSFLGKSMRIRLAQSVQVDTPFHLIEAAAARLHLPRGYAVEHEQARSPTAYMRVSLWPAQLQRAAIGFTCATSHALATAPASVRVDSGTTRRWGTRILLRVMGGYVSRIQVLDARHALDACVTFCLTSAAANTGGLLDCMPRVPSPRWQGAHPGPLPTVLFFWRRNAFIYLIPHTLAPHCFFDCRLLLPSASQVCAIFA
jgi:hypothetical protein